MMNQRDKYARRRLFKVGIRKHYFPKELWPRPKELTAYIEPCQKIYATSRQGAAEKAWERHGDRWLAMMLPNRKAVSLEVNEPAVAGNTMGRLQEVNVYQQTEESKIKQAAMWATTEFEKRTRAIAADPTGKSFSLYWVCPSTRVSWHEICQAFDMDVVGPAHRTEFQLLFEKEMRRRKLLAVLRGTMKADEWVEKFGQDSQ